MDDKISVIVPVYNVELYLERCLDSIIHNTYKNLEIICVDDDSTDGCGGILDRYAQMDERVVVIHRENGGLSAARNSGVDAATGDFVSFIDSDDWIHPQYFEILLHMQKKADYDLVICGFSRPTEVKPYKTYNLEELSGKELELEGIYQSWEAKTYAWGKLYSRELVEGSRFVEKIRIAEDAAFNALVLGKHDAVKAVSLSVPLYCYFDRPGSLTYMLKGKETLALGEILYQYAEDATTVRARRMYLLEALKRGLSARYFLPLQSEERDPVEKSGKLVRRGARELRRLPNVSVKEKLLYSAFDCLPSLYRLYRIVNDPTLLTLERSVRKERKRSDKKQAG